MSEGSILKYKAFLTVVETGSFSRAAEVMAYSQSGISRMIRDLEDEWGVALLERGKFGVRLTTDGEQLLPFISDICRDQDNLESRVDMINGLEKGHVRVGTFTSISSNLMPQILKGFLEEYPKIDFELLMGEYDFIREAILEGKADLGFLTESMAEGLDFTPLLEDEYKVVLPKGHPLARLKKIPLAKLKNYPFISLEKDRRSETPEVFAEEMQEMDVKFTTWDDYAIMSMVESGLGISILPGMVLRRCPYDIIIKSLEKPRYRTIGIATKNGVRMSVAVSRFTEFLRTKLDLFKQDEIEK